jgi:hypothetical protein
MDACWQQRPCQQYWSQLPKRRLTRNQNLTPDCTWTETHLMLDYVIF